MGAGEGSFLRTLLDAGFPGRNLCAIEYSERARRTISAMDPAITVLGSVSELSSTSFSESFDYAFAFQVLEHLDQPIQFLSLLSQGLAKDGLAFVSVPNPARIRFNESNGLLLDMPPNHVSRIDVHTIPFLAKRAGLHVERSIVQPFVASDALKQFVNYRFKRQTQLAGTVESSLERLLPSMAAKAIGALLATPDALLTLRDRSDGESLLFIMRKP